VLYRWATRLALVGMALLGSAVMPVDVPEPHAARAVVLEQGVGNFDGPWYVSGDLTTPALIIQAGTSLTLMNEQGRVATASATTSQLTANWGDGPIVGNLSGDQRQIDWANGTFWQRRALIGAGFLGGPNVGGIWYVGDTSTQRAIVVQEPGGALHLMNEQGRSSPGTFVGPNTIRANAWEGGVQGSLSPDGNFIDWSNDTHWRR
jgi:hypothetical protein